MGRASMREDRSSDALGYFHKALQLDPTHLGARAGLAAALAKQRQFADAAAAYEMLLSGPVSWFRPDLLNQLGLTLLRAGDPARAADSFRQASALVEDDAEMLRSRAYAQLGVGNGAVAADTARTCLQRENLADEHRPYLAIVAFLGARMAGLDDADSALQRPCADRVGDWPVPICDYPLGQIDETKVFGAAGNDKDRLTEAHAYVGLNLLAGGRREAAVPHLTWVVQSGNRQFVEYPLAQDTLARLNDTGGR
jgi:lipoprotein NlpI